MITLNLPWPPTVNTYWRNISRGRHAGRVLISETGRNYRKAVDAVVRDAHARKGYRGDLTVNIVAFPPDRRRRDLDNLLKGILDSLGHAGVYEDDSQVAMLSIKRSGVRHPGGLIAISIGEIAATDTGWREALGEAA